MTAILPAAVSVGHVIDGRFPLLRQLGESEWSAAFLTILDDGSQKKAAIKIFPFESVDARVTLAKWEVARTLSHPHLMPIFDAARIDVEGEELLYVVTEYADETLSQILPERALTPDEAREMLHTVLNPLTFLHRFGLAHGHLRPTNIMVVDDHLKLSPDFGWRLRGRSIYDAPEAEEGDLDPAADIWSLGILLVEALTQQPPSWDRSQDSEPAIPPTIPEHFFSIARECLRVDPAHRITLAEINARLEPPQTIAEVNEPQSDTVPRRKLFSSSRAIAVAGAAIALFFFIAAFKFGYDLTPSNPLSLPGLPARTQTQPPLQKSTAPLAQAAPTSFAPTVAPATKQPPTEPSDPGRH